MLKMARSYTGPRDTDLVPDEQQIRDHFEFWFHHAIKGLIEIAWYNPNSGGLTNFQRFETGAIDPLVARVCELNRVPGQSTYFRPALIRPDIDPAAYTTDNDFFAAPGAWVDLDDKDAVNASPKLYKALPATALVITGTNPHIRAQMFWRTDEIIYHAPMVRRLNANITRKLNGDTAVINPTTLMRIGGTIAWPYKGGRVIELTRFKRQFNDNRISAVTIHALLHYFPDEETALERLRAEVEAAPPRPAPMVPAISSTVTPTATAPQLIASSDGSPVHSAITGRLNVNLALENIRAGRQWHNNVVALTAHWVACGRSDAEIMAEAESFTLPGYKPSDTAREVTKAIVGARKKWDKPEQDPSTVGTARAGEPSGFPEFPTMPPEAFTGLAGDIVRLIGPHTESDLAGLLLSTHAYFGNCVGRGPHYLVESTQHGPNLFVLKIGDTAKARKGTGEDRVRSLFRLVDEGWETTRVHTGLSTGEGLIWAVRDRITRFVRDKNGANAVMIEEILDEGIADKRLAIIESEFAGVLRVMQREGNTLSRVLRDGWDRGDLASLTKSSPARATGAGISVIGHITAAELRECLDRTEMANGFGNRFLFASVRRSKLLPFGGDLPEAALFETASKVRLGVDRARTVGRVGMSPQARQAWIEIYHDLSAGKPGLLGALTARAEAQVVRLAMLYALWDRRDQIELDDLTAAIAVWEYCAASVQYVFGELLGDQVADTILAALKNAGDSGLTRTEISALFSRNMAASQIVRALGELDRAQLARCKKVTGNSGRPPEAWVYSRDGAT
jgi:hypothetical protein